MIEFMEVFLMTLRRHGEDVNYALLFDKGVAVGIFSREFSSGEWWSIPSSLNTLMQLGRDTCPKGRMVRDEE